MWPAPNKNFGHWVSNELPWLDNISQMPQFSAGGIKCILYGSMERRILGAYTWFPLDIASYGFPFADFGLYYFAVINYSCEHNDVLSPVGYPSESPNPRVVSGTPDIASSSETSYRGSQWRLYNLSTLFSFWHYGNVQQNNSLICCDLNVEIYKLSDNYFIFERIGKIRNFLTWFIIIKLRNLSLYQIL